MYAQVFEKHSNLPHRQPVKTAHEPACRAARYRARVSDTADSILTHPSVARVRATLAEAGVQGAVVVLDGAARTDAQAAAYLGVDVAQIANSLVFTFLMDSGSQDESSAPPELQPLLILTSGAHRVDIDAVQVRLEGRLGRADASFVKDRTGFVIGGVAPVGHLQPVRTYIDRDLAAYDTIWAAAGHPHTVFPTTFAELVRITGAQPLDVGK